MSRISQTFSLLSNLSTFSVGVENEQAETLTEHFLPRKQDAMFGDQFIFQTTSLRQRINAKLVLLAPLPCDAPPFAKSVIFLSSLSGPVSANVYRHPSAETHFFRLYIFARAADVKVTLPSLFRGVVNVRNHDGSCHKRRAHYCRVFRDRMRCGLIRLDSYVPEDGDELYIHTEGRIELHLMPLSPGNDGGGNAGSRVGRHVRRIFGTT